MALLHSTWQYIPQPWLYSTLLDSTLLYRWSTQLYMTLHYSTVALLHCTRLYITLPFLYSTLLDPTLLYRCCTPLYLTLHYRTVALLHSTWLYTSSMHNMFGASVRKVYNIIWCQFDLKIDHFILMIGQKKKKKRMVVYAWQIDHHHTWEDEWSNCRWLLGCSVVQGSLQLLLETRWGRP